MLNLRYLSYFLASANHGGFSQASEKINISKSAIVRAVDFLEQDLGTRLFVRERAKGVRLTNDGQHLFQLCQELFRDLKNLETKMFDLGTVSGELVVTCIESLGACILPDLVIQTKRTYPNLDIKTVEADPDEAIELLHRGEADVLINARPIATDLSRPKWLECETLMEPVLCVTLSDQHPLAYKPSVTLEDLLEYSMIIISKSYIAQMSLLYFKRINRFPRIAVRTNTIENLRAFIGKGFGYGLTHFRPVVDASFTGNSVITRPVSGISPGIEIIAGYANRNENWMPVKIRAFLEETRQYFQSNTCSRYFFTNFDV